MILQVLMCDILDLKKSRELYNKKNESQCRLDLYLHNAFTLVPQFE